MKQIDSTGVRTEARRCVERAMVHAQALVESTNLTGKLDVRRHRRLLRALGRAHYAIEALPR